MPVTASSWRGDRYLSAAGCSQIITGAHLGVHHAALAVALQRAGGAAAVLNLVDDAQLEIAADRANNAAGTAPLTAEGHTLAGVASALLNTAQQIGAALGLALLTAVSIANLLPRALGDGDTGLIEQAGQALTHGYASALGVEAVLLFAAAVIAALTLQTKLADHAPTPGAAEMPR